MFQKHMNVHHLTTPPDFLGTQTGSIANNFIWVD